MFHKRSEDVDAIRKTVRHIDFRTSDSALLGEGWLLVLRNIFERVVEKESF